MKSAKDYFAAAKNRGLAPEANANLSLIALKDGQLKDAEYLISQATDANGLAQALGNLNIAKGNYATAVKDFGDSFTNSAALAQLLNKDYAAAAATLNNIKNADGLTYYLKALVLNRQGNKTAAKQALNEAISKDSSLADYAKKDLELANLR